MRVVYDCLSPHTVGGVGSCRRHDAVYTASLPSFSVPAAAFVRRRAGFHLKVDRHEFWTHGYQREYLDRLGRWLGWRVQARCLCAPQRALTVLEGQFEHEPAAAPLPAEPVVVFAERGLEGIIEAQGFVDAATIDDASSRTLCLVLPSRREGYGLVVLEGLSRGTPAVLVRDEDNCAVGLVKDGDSGVMAETEPAGNIAAAIVHVRKGGQELRDPALARFRCDVERRSLTSSLGARSTAHGARR